MEILTAEERVERAEILKGILGIVFYLIILNNPDHKVLIVVCRRLCKMFGIDIDEALDK